MDNFRRRNRGNKPQAIDGFLNAPVRPQTSGQPQGRRASRFNGLRPSGRRLDDFRRSEGFRSSQGRVGATPTPQPSVSSQGPTGRQPSLLHMTLPPGGAMLGDAKRRDKQKEKARGKHSRWRTIRKWTLRSALVLAVLVLITGGFLLFKGIIKLHKVFKGGGSAPALQAEVRPELLKGEGDGRVNILLLGKGGAGHAGADLTDTIIVASIDPVNKTASLVSIPRDLWVTVQGYGSSKINAVYAYAKQRALNKNPKDTGAAETAGVNAIEDEVGQVLGIPIHYYGMIDFTGFEQAVNVVNGVDINVPEELTVRETLWDELTRKQYRLDVPAGLQHFDGQRALYFTRSRHTSRRGDFDRTERQRLFIQALTAKVLSAGTYTNPVKISQLMSAFGDHMSTDLSVNNALRLVEIGKSIDISKLQSIGLADPPNNFLVTGMVGNQSVVRPTAGFGDYSDIQNYIRNTLRDPYLAKENARVVVLNGTSVGGLATQKSDELKSYGYNVTKVGDAPTHDYARTVLVDVSGGKNPFTESYLEKRLEVKSTTRLPAGLQAQDADFVVILGQDD